MVSLLNGMGVKNACTWSGRIEKVIEDKWAAGEKMATRVQACKAERQSLAT